MSCLQPVLVVVPLSSEFPTSRLEMTAVADIFDRDGDGYIDYYEFVAALHPNKDAYRPTTDADKIEDEVGDLEQPQTNSFIYTHRDIEATLSFELYRSICRM